jgi:Dyp-type peroxidase family
VPEESLASFPEAFRAGMAARADELLDTGANAPEHWEPEFGSGRIHIGVSVFSDSQETWQRTMTLARRHYEGSAGEAGEPLPAPQPDVLGRNGTFVGLRKYQSLVGTFNRFQRTHAETEHERELLAAKLVGRWRSGAPLTLAPTDDDPALGADPMRNDDFSYADDPDGRRVPLGSHMRRMNPRDTELALLTDVNVHRIIRRSTAYGAPYDPNAITRQDDETARGLYFIFISAKAMATLEFLQREWINNGNFMSLGDERDPNVGLQEDGATFTIPQEPVRRRIHGIETFNVLRGGEYFFLPSLSALRWLGTLTPDATG